MTSPDLPPVTRVSSPAVPALARRALPALALMPAMLLLAVVLAPPLNHDVAAVLAFTRRWLGGEALYRDLVDVNPPLVFLLNLPAAAVGAALPGAEVPVLQACLLGWVALSVGLALRLLERAGPVEGAALTAGLPALALAAGYDFGQREHLMAVGALPYLVVAARRADGVPPGRAACLGTALLAGLGFALKPHFLAIPALVEGYLLWRRGPARAVRDPVPWAMAGLWLLYLAAIPICF
ncbi:MAG TPA: hypothetical protein VE684_20710, partial [Crenalkalicoccus sp.]|nr:hypothetical protein [Crenalkalicoccus sp.]